LTAATVAALLIAVASFLALDTPEEEEPIPRDAYTVNADGICLDGKRRVAAALRRTPSADGGGQDRLVATLLPVVADWRTKFQELAVPPDRAEEAGALDSALRQVEIELGGLGLVSSSGRRGRIAARAAEVDAATVAVEEAVAGLGLTQCAARRVGFPTPSE
jgi:hypothetical protein